MHVCKVYVCSPAEITADELTEFVESHMKPGVSGPFFSHSQVGVFGGGKQYLSRVEIGAKVAAALEGMGIKVLGRE